MICCFYRAYTFRQVSCPTVSKSSARSAHLLQLHLLTCSCIQVLVGSFTVSKGPNPPAGQLIDRLYRTYSTGQASWSDLTGPILYSSREVSKSPASTGPTHPTRSADFTVSTGPTSPTMSADTTYCTPTARSVNSLPLQDLLLQQGQLIYCVYRPILLTRSADTAFTGSTPPAMQVIVVHWLYIGLTPSARSADLLRLQDLLLLLGQLVFSLKGPVLVHCPLLVTEQLGEWEEEKLFIFNKLSGILPLTGPQMRYAYA